MSSIHDECLDYVGENDFVQVRYAQGNWQTRDTELLLYLDIPGKPPIVAVGLTQRAVDCVHELSRLDQDTEEASTISRAGAMMRVASGRDDIPCAAFLRPHDAPPLQEYLKWAESVT